VAAYGPAGWDSPTLLCDHSLHITGGRPISLELTKLLSLLLYPLSQALLLGLLALLAMVLQCSRTAFLAGALALGWLYLCSTAVFADYLMGILEDPYPPKALSATAEADAIVLLGGAIRGDTHMGTLGDLNQQADRLVHAVQLFKAGKAPRLLVTGGAPPGARTEAEIMSDLLQVMGVPASAILQERESRDSHDNAVYTAAMLEGLGMKKILLVTSAFHMRRSEALFAGRGLEVIPAPTDYQRGVGPRVLSPWLPSVSDLWRSTYALHEMVGFWVYRYRGWL
jgi:uncharacterized SAM-binding protein YcdF (DUF218 family)